MRRLPIGLACTAGAVGMVALLHFSGRGGDINPAYTPAIPPSVISAVQPAADRQDQVSQQHRSGPSLTEHAPTPFHWSQLESTNYHEYIANLREVGCPELTIRDIIVADVRHLFRGRHEGSPEEAEAVIRSLVHLNSLAHEVSLETQHNAPLVASATDTTKPESAGGLAHGLSRQSEDITPSSGVLNESALTEEGGREKFITEEPSFSELESIMRDLLPDPEESAEPSREVEDLSDQALEVLPSDLNIPANTRITTETPAELMDLARNHRVSSLLMTAAWTMIQLKTREGTNERDSDQLESAARQLIGVNAFQELSRLHSAKLAADRLNP